MSVVILSQIILVSTHSALGQGFQLQVSGRDGSPGVQEEPHVPEPPAPEPPEPPEPPAPPVLEPEPRDSSATPFADAYD